MKTFALVAVSLAAVVLGHECLGASPAEIRDANRLNNSAIKTITLKCTVRSDIHLSPELNGMSESFKPVFRLNQHLLETHQVALDVSKGEWKLEIHDLRDINKLLADNHIEERQRVNLCRTASILEANQFEAKLLGDYNLLHVSKGHRPPDAVPKPEAFKNGALPEAIFANLDSVKITETPFLKLTIRLVEGLSVIRIDPHIGYRYLTWDQYDGNGKLVVRRTAEDYRIENGIPYPFKHIEQRWNSKQDLIKEDTIEVERVQLNQIMDDASLQLELPADTRIQHDLNKVFIKTDPRMRVGVKSLRSMKGRP